MKAKLTIISSLILAAMLFCLGCEPEPKTTTAEPPAEVTTEQTQPSQEQSRAEVEMMLQQELDRRVAEQQQPGTAQQAAPAEAVPTKPGEQAVPQTAQPPQVEPQVSQPSPNDVMVTVNGIEITRAKVDEIVKPRIEQIKGRIAGRGMPEGYLEGVEKRLTQAETERVIIDSLVGEQMKQHNIIVTEQQIETYIAQFAAREDMTVDDLKALVAAGGETYEQWKKQMRFDKIVGVLKLIEATNFGTLDVNEAQALAFYNDNSQLYEKPGYIRVRHILVSPDASDMNTDPNQADAKAKAKAEELLSQIKEGADFAELAKSYSSCPSARQGGYLGFSKPENWVKPFAHAAEELQPGQVSEVVKTQFGYHIIKREADVISFDEAKDGIVKMLRGRREMELVSKYIKSLRDNAQIIYAKGAQPEPSDEEVLQ